MKTQTLGACLVSILAMGALLPGSSQIKPGAKTPTRTTAVKPAVTVNPAQAAHLNNLGAAYMNQQLFEKALKAFEQAEALDPGLRVARVNRGVALLNLGRVEQARSILQPAVKSDPRDANAWYNLGLLEKNSSDPEPAIQAFLKVTELDASDADTWYFLGATYSQLKRYPEAIGAFEHALKINPLHASALFGISQAYQRSGDTDKAREHLERFQYVTRNKLGAAISLAYGEQGKYSLAEESPIAPLKPPPPSEVKFVDATRIAGVTGKVVEAADNPSSALGSGACFLDYDNDGRIDLLLADHGPSGGVALLHNTLGRFEDMTRAAGLDPEEHAVGCAAGDYDNDGSTDLALSFNGGVILLHNEKNGKFKDVTEPAGILTNTLNLGVTFIDYDHDGDLDLLITRHDDAAGWSQMFRNNGNGTFSDVTETIGLEAMESAGAVTVVGSDYNNDRAVDLVVPDLGPSILENPREGRFPVRKPWPGAMPSPVRGVAILDFDHDGWMDIAFTHAAQPGLSLWRNQQGKSFAPVALPDLGLREGWGVVAFDYDDDGWVDLAATGSSADGRGEIRLLRNLGGDGFKDVSASVGLDQLALHDPRGLITGDYDNDGASDLLVTQRAAPALLLRNQGGNKNHWLRVALKGLNDNKSAIGTKVEVLAGGVRQKFEVSGSSGYLGQNSPFLTVGLGQSKAADVVRMLWPTGVLQDEVEVAGMKSQIMTEIDRRGSSCPTLFAWDGNRYRLVGDMLGAGVVGHWVGPEQRNIPRPAEYMKLDRTALRTRNGKLAFRFMEPLEEAVYLDRVQLLAVDHPAEFSVYPNEYFASNPPYAPFKIVFSRGAHPPAGAWDEHGHNLLPNLLAHRFTGDFELLSFAGFTKMHSLELDLGEPYSGGPLWLLAHGEIEYFTATSMYAADQAGLQPVAPFVEAQTSDGKWIRVMDDMGFPAGGPRTMTADLSGKLPHGTRRIQITTNLQIYWDSILIDRTAQEQQFKTTFVPLSSAQLRFHGFPLKVENQPPGNVAYRYEIASPTGPYTRPAGFYTRYGDVRPLLSGFDDRLAVFGSGDEVVLEFDPAKLPALPAGWTRDYFFLANGYEKDMDFYAADGNTVDPLPSRRMSQYPDDARALDDRRLRDLLEYNTRSVSGNEARSYRFQYGARH